MRSIFPDIVRTVNNAVKRAGFTVIHALGIPRSRYYAQNSILPLLDRRFNPFAAGYAEWIVIGYKHKHPGISFREIAYTLMDEYLAYLSPSTVYRILKKHDLITEWHMNTWPSTRPEHANRPDERWQTDIMYIKIGGRFFYLLIFIDEYSRYIVHHALLTSMDADSAAQSLHYLAVKGGFATCLRTHRATLIDTAFKLLENGIRPNVANILLDLKPKEEA